MKVHYINILLFALPLNILVYNQRNHKSPTPHTPKITTTRSLCECELYAPVNYDNDPQMKEIMENFNKQTQQRFHEYDERIQEKRQKCKDQCDKEIQKIILKDKLKDKLEKQMEEQLTTLETKVDTDDIPTCVCKKSMADKVEKGCLRCGYGLGTVAPTVGLIGSVAVNVWKTAKIAAATQEAIAQGAVKGAAAGAEAGIKVVMDILISDSGLSIESMQKMGLFLNATNYNNVSNITTAIYTKFNGSCMPAIPGYGVTPDPAFCSSNWQQSLFTNGASSRDLIKNAINKNVESMVSQAEGAAKAEAAKVAAAEEAKAIKTSTDAIEAASIELYPGIGYSILAILIIVLIMVIIYLILRYRRKKKMKKKLQYIKLLEE
ncbi:rifin [Plasmodium reichenowi]|uniref:Rifin n=1 Tax=Plasmodium reichenowi TaxID=5854 RepID=A0A060RQI1_PLARE|nr:rifin [Plasmodium reichenowi]